jgi:hypothetical protein
MQNEVESSVNEALTVADDVAGAAAMSGNPLAGAVALGLGAADDVAKSVEADVAAGAAPAAIAASAVASLMDAAVPAVAALPVAQQAQATGILANIEALLNDFIKFF